MFQTVKQARASTAGVMAAAGMALTCVSAPAADLVQPAPPPELQLQPKWEFRITPYGWLPSMKGTQTVKGRSAAVDASFLEILRKSDTLVGLMADFEARYGRWSLIADVAWSKVALEGNTLRSRSPAPGITGTVGAALGVSFQMAIIEMGLTYEVARSGAWALDVLAGARYWRQKADVSLDVTGTLDLAGLDINGARAVSRSGNVDWVDPMVGARLRYSIAPGHDLSLRADLGGFGVGSSFSWQGVAAYGFDFAVSQGVTYSGVIGYRALYVDYAKGSGRTRYEFDMLQHGPIVGLSARF